MYPEREKLFFNDKVVVITGSTIGIGRRLAAELAGLGALVVLNGRNPERLEKVRAELAQTGARVLAVAGDVSEPAFCRRLADTTVQTFGRIDVLVNNAGMNMFGTVEASDALAMQRIMDINFWGALWTTRAALPYLRQSRGSVLFMSSIAAFHGLPLNAVYSASKRALASLAESLRIEHHDSGIHFGVAFIGMTETEAAKTVYDQNGLPISRPPVPGGPPLEPIGVVTPAIRRMIVRRENQRVFSTIGRINYWVNRLMPGLAHLVLLKNYKKRQL